MSTNDLPKDLLLRGWASEMSTVTGPSRESSSIFGVGGFTPGIAFGADISLALQVGRPAKRFSHCGSVELWAAERRVDIVKLFTISVSQPGTYGYRNSCPSPCATRCAGIPPGRGQRTAAIHTTALELGGWGRRIVM